MGCSESQDILDSIPFYITQNHVFPEMSVALVAVIMSVEIIYIYIKSNLQILTLVEMLFVKDASCDHCHPSSGVGSNLKKN